jgi:hypothetical protein
VTRAAVASDAMKDRWTGSWTEHNHSVLMDYTGSGVSAVAGTAAGVVAGLVADLVAGLVVVDVVGCLSAHLSKDGVVESTAPSAFYVSIVQSYALSSQYL